MKIDDIKVQMEAKKVEVFFDYVCPYCYKGHPMVEEVCKDLGLEILWRPCEVDPMSKRSHAAVIGAYYLLARDLPTEAYHQAMFDAYFQEHKNLNDVDTVLHIAKLIGIEEEGFVEAVRTLAYEEWISKGNEYGWVEKQFEAIPSYSYGPKSIGSGSGRLVSKEDLVAFLTK